MKKRIFIILLTALTVTTIFAQGRKELRFNEVMMVNDSSYIDQCGQRLPWVEIFNRSYGTVGMEQMFISNQPIDIPDNGMKPKDFLNDFSKKNPNICYEIPRGDRATKVAPRTHIVFYADGNPAAGALHLSYKLNPAVVNKLYLYDVNGDLVDVLEIPAGMKANNTFALKVDGSSEQAVFNANDWSMRDGTDVEQAITPGKFNLADQNDNIEAFHVRDPYGVIIALMAMSVVFSALLILFLCFKLFGKFFGRKQEAENAAVVSDEPTPAIAAGNGDDEAIAAIGMALFQHLNAHDQESGIITIDHAHEANSAWISKLNAMGRMPIHKEQ
ncbi:MAG: OadG family protein [Muribaculaceae bacterium]|nr:OadG family protein [Muribaculaceae bacterium]